MMHLFNSPKILKLRAVILVGLVLFFLYNSFDTDQKNKFENTLQKLQQYLVNYNHNILYLHTNGNKFVQGDTVWFKAYNVKSGSLLPSLNGNFLNVGLYPAGDKINAGISGKFKFQNGFSCGQLEIPDTLASGKYFLIALPNYSFPAPSEDIFKKEIEITDIKNNEITLKLSMADSVYSEGNSVKGTLEAFGDNNSKFGKLKIRISLKQGDNTLEETVINTGEEGVGNFDIKIPEQLGNKAVSLSARVQEKGMTGKLNVNIPVKTLYPAVQFFPEGGEMVKGINSLVAFEATDIAGNPFDFKGIVTDSTGRVITEVQTTGLGMGSTTIQPQKNNRLFLQILKPGGYDHKYELPEAKQSGYSLKILENNNENLILRVESNVCQPTDSVSVLVLVRDKIWFAETKPLNALQNLNIPVSEMPFGIAKVTVFDPYGLPQAERLVFLNEDKKPEIHTESLKDAYVRKEKVNINLGITDKSGNPAEGSFSVSVVPANTADDEIWSDNITTSLMLSDELKGEIPGKGIYFSANKNSKELLDLLLLTHGWRKFTWQKIMEGSNENISFGQGLTGTVTTRKGKPVKNTDLTIMNVSTFFAATTKTDNEGRFYFNNSELINMLDFSKLVITATNSQGGKNVYIHINNFVPQEELTAILQNPQQNDASLYAGFFQNETSDADSTGIFPKEYYSNMTEKNIWIGEVQVKARIPVIIPPEVYEKEHESYELKDDQININLGADENSGIYQLLHQAAGYFKVAEGGKVLFRGFNSLYESNMQGAVFVVDGRVVGYSVYDINYLNANDIEKIKVTKSSAAGLKYTPYASGGLVEITTKGYKTGNRPVMTVNSDPNIAYFAGYKQVRKFYSPVYKNTEAKNKAIDFRKTLYWEPELPVVKGKAKLSYFNSDVPGDYVIRIEGISTTGIPVYTTKKYTVKE